MKLDESLKPREIKYEQDITDDVQNTGASFMINIKGGKSSKNAFFSHQILVHEAGPQSQTVYLFSHMSSDVRQSPLVKAKQILSEINVHYLRDCGSGRVDH